MAASPPVTPSRETILENDVKYRRGLSEAILFKMAASINFINDRIIDRYAFNFGGYYRVQSVAQNTFPSIYIKRETKVSYYTMKIDNTGDSGNNEVNFKVIDENGTEVGNLFSTAPRLNQASLVNGMVGYDVKNSSEIRKVVTNPANFDNGVVDPAYETLPAGYELKMFLVSSSNNARNLSVNLGLEAQS